MFSLFSPVKDGGPKSRVWAYFLENKKLGSIGLLKFKDGSREAFHSHAFDCASLILGPGRLKEVFKDGRVRFHLPFKFLVTRKDDFHKVYSKGTTWVLTVRGPWDPTWEEVDEEGQHKTLSWGRKEVGGTDGNRTRLTR